MIILMEIAIIFRKSFEYIMHAAVHIAHVSENKLNIADSRIFYFVITFSTRQSFARRFFINSDMNERTHKFHSVMETYHINYADVLTKANE